MRLLTKISLVPLFALAASGCIVEHDPGPYDGPAPAPAPAPAPSPAVDAAEPMGAQAMLGYHVLANGSAALPDGDLGFVVTANGGGGYRITWSDTLGSAADFSGTITTDGYFQSVQPYSGEEYIDTPDSSTVTFESQPGTYVDGVDVVSSTDPIYVDLLVDGSHYGFSIYFTGGETGTLQTAAYNPVAFTSP